MRRVLSLYVSILASKVILSTGLRCFTTQISLSQISKQRKELSPHMIIFWPQIVNIDNLLNLTFAIGDAQFKDSYQFLSESFHPHFQLL